MRRSLLILFLLLVLSQMAGAAAAQQDSSAQAADPSFHLISEQEGWLLVNQRLLWTKTGGESWQDITPATPAAIRAVFFRDAQNGWVLASRAAEAEKMDYVLARTVDGGKTWQNQTLALFDQGASQSNTRAASLYFIDAETGWMVLRQATSSNFVVGALFHTRDGGRSWTPLSIPIAEPVYFVNRSLGWTAGGPAGDQFYRTVDGGRTWNAAEPGGSPSPNQAPRLFSLPDFRNEREGVAFVVIPSGAETQVEVYRSHNGGESWDIESRLLASQPTTVAGDLPVAIFDVDDWLLLAPQQQLFVSRTPGVGIKTFNSSDPFTLNLRRLEMGTRQVGWAWYSTGDCAFGVGISSVRPKANMACKQDTRLLRTKDSGLTWQAISLPGTVSAQMGPRVLSTPQTMTAQGFDKCEVPTLSQLQTWWAYSPYDAVNLYIGGLNRHCSNSALNASYVAQIHNQGWKFIPTWVGRQAPCTGASYPYKFSSDPATAYNQGAGEANDAANAAANLGFGAGAVIYTDIEWFDASNTGCRNAASSFVSGWSGQLRARGYKAGAYGATCSGVTDWVGVANVPDALWGAWWNYSSYNAGASVWGLPCLSDALWSNHQRIHQYAGDHYGTWGGVTLRIDSDAIDGLVADIGDNPSPPPSPPAAPSNPNPTDGARLPRTSRLTLYWNTNGTTCDLHIWGGDVGDRVYSGLGCESAFFGAHLGGVYQWQVTARNSAGSTAGPTWRFYIQPDSPTNLRATRLSPSQISLSWTRSADDPGGIDNYRVYRNGTVLTTLAPGSSSLTVDDSGCATNYSFYLTAVHDSVESPPSNRVWNCNYFPIIVK